MVYWRRDDTITGVQYRYLKQEMQSSNVHSMLA